MQSVGADQFAVATVDEGVISVNQAQLIARVFECRNRFNKAINLQVIVPVVERVGRSKMREEIISLDIVPAVAAWKKDNANL